MKADDVTSKETKAYLKRSDRRRPAFFNISVQKKKFPTQGPEFRNSNKR